MRIEEHLRTPESTGPLHIPFDRLSPRCYALDQQDRAVRFMIGSKLFSEGLFHVADFPLHFTGNLFCGALVP